MISGGEEFSHGACTDESCRASCDAGFFAVKGDGVFSCLHGAWMGSLVCRAFDCGVTLDRAAPADSAFLPCSGGGSNVGNVCVTSCKAGFYSAVGTGTVRRKKDPRFPAKQAKQFSCVLRIPADSYGTAGLFRRPSSARRSQRTRAVRSGWSRASRRGAATLQISRRCYIHPQVNVLTKHV